MKENRKNMRLNNIASILDQYSIFWQSIRPFATSEDGKQFQRWQRRQRGLRWLWSISIVVATHRGGLRRETSFASGSSLCAHGAMASPDRFSLVRGGSRDAAIWSTMCWECQIGQGKGFVICFPLANFKTIQCWYLQPFYLQATNLNRSYEVFIFLFLCRSNGSQNRFWLKCSPRSAEVLLLRYYFQVLLELSDAELEAGLGVTHPLHRKKLRLAIEEHRHPSHVRYPCIAQLGHTWVSSEWLPDLGLAQYSESFATNMVDARMLDHLSKKELEKLLGVTRKFHQASIVHGIHLLRMLNYDRQVSEFASTEVILQDNEFVGKIWRWKLISSLWRLIKCNCDWALPSKRRYLVFVAGSRCQKTSMWAGRHGSFGLDESKVHSVGEKHRSHGIRRKFERWIVFRRDQLHIFIIENFTNYLSPYIIYDNYSWLQFAKFHI